jgi:hypothetical protein
LPKSTVYGEVVVETCGRGQRIKGTYEKIFVAGVEGRVVLDALWLRRVG